MVWAKLGTKTATTTVNPLEVDAITTPSTFNQVMIHWVNTANAEQRIRLGSTTLDTGSNYASRRQSNGGTDGTFDTQAYMRFADAETAAPDGYLGVGYIVNIAGEEKLMIMSAIRTGDGDGAGAAPSRQETAGKWANTSNQFDRAGLTLSAGNAATDSNITVLGSEGVESLNVQDGAVYYEIDTNKSYVLYNNSWTEL